MNGSDGRYDGVASAFPAPGSLGAGDGVALLKGGALRTSVLAFGNRRSSDGCRNDRGTVVDMRAMNRILAFNPVTGLLEAEAGALMSDIIAFAAPHGWFPAVAPGTQFVTLGGAIANDVHGMNHHCRGSFGCHVESFTLLRSDGQVYQCSPYGNVRLFWSTIGGLGLTGIILQARIRLLTVPSLDIIEDVKPFGSLGECFELVDAATGVNEYVIARMAPHGNVGRGLLVTGNHAEHGSLVGIDLRQRRAFPFPLPGRTWSSLIDRLQFARRKARGPRKIGYQGFLFPLDRLGHWSREQVAGELLRHQSVIPDAGAGEALPALLSAARRAEGGWLRAALQRFGSFRSPGLLSFPRSGWTLTFDFQNRGRATLDLLDELDAIATGAGGAVNPATDVSMSAATFAASFPCWQRLESLRDPAFMSNFWERTGLALAFRRSASAQAAE